SGGGAATGGGSAGSGGSGAGGSGGSAGGVAFVADAPAVYVAKVKNVLVGLPPTDSEIATVTADPTQLATLVNGWVALPQYQLKMRRFFELAFQQTQVKSADYAVIVRGGGVNLIMPML